VFCSGFILIDLFIVIYFIVCLLFIVQCASVLFLLVDGNIMIITDAVFLRCVSSSCLLKVIEKFLQIKEPASSAFSPVVVKVVSHLYAVSTAKV